MCKFCERKDNDMVTLNDSMGWSLVEIAMNRQEMLRVRSYTKSHDLTVFDSQDIVNINFCPKCGKKLREELVQ